ncbi:MAG: sigma-70 family RNA polymerase sigma factor [Ruthenibacterium sp.]
MIYNKAKAEREWLRRKESEELQLRQLGVDEDMIQRLHTYDWQSFKSERNFMRWQQVDGTVLENISATNKSDGIYDIDTLLAEIDNEQLHALLQSTGRLTLQILIYKINGYKSSEIGDLLSLNTTSVDKRLSRLRQKIKNL